MAGIVSGLVMNISEKLSGTLAVKTIASATEMIICPGTGSMAQ